MTSVYVLNAFTDSREGGNPAGVVPDASSLSEEQMQRIAKSLGYSETAFVMPSDVADFRVRFFTPSAEVDLCGHATVATFVLLFQLRKLSAGTYTQQTKAGILEIEISEAGEVFMTQSKPAFFQYVEKELIAKSLTLDVDFLHADLPSQIVSTGLRDIIVPVKDLDSLNGIQPDFQAISDVSRRLDVVGYHIFTSQTLFGSTAHCRNFAPLYDIPEEAATGTASGALSSYLFKHGMVHGLVQPGDGNATAFLLFEQGYSMNRPSTIKSRLEIRDAEISKVEVGGKAKLISGPTALSE